MNYFLRVLADTNSITPDFSNAPGLSFMAKVASWCEGGGLICAVIGLACGAVGFLFGKLGHNARAQEIGISFAGWALATAAIISAAGKLIGWGAGQPLI